MRHSPARHSISKNQYSQQTLVDRKCIVYHVFNPEKKQEKATIDQNTSRLLIQNIIFTKFWITVQPHPRQQNHVKTTKMNL